MPVSSQPSKPETSSLSALGSEKAKELESLSGRVHLLSYMIRKQLPLTRETFVDLNYMGKEPDLVEDPEVARVLELLPD
jgi:hypothetical protein